MVEATLLTSTSTPTPTEPRVHAIPGSLMPFDVGDEVTLVGENQSVYIPLGAKHRMENPGKVPMVLIEVQTGSYLGEDDIIRYEDVYARS